jgi:hypothetical protein
VLGQAGVLVTKIENKIQAESVSQYACETSVCTLSAALDQATPSSYDDTDSG